MTSHALIMAMVQVTSAFAYFSIAILSLARGLRAPWWIFRVTICVQSVHALTDCILILRHPQMVVNEISSWISVVAALAGAGCFLLLAQAMSKQIKQLTSTPDPEDKWKD
jgi:hypothetical protein